MRIVLPELEIKPCDGFKEEIDIFHRKEFGEKLAALIQNSENDLVLALNSQWGEGKTTFISMWRGYVESHRDDKFKTIYFDAFSNDYQKEPFLALASEVYELYGDEDSEKKEEFKKKAIAVGKSLTRGLLKTAVQIGTAGIISGSMVDSAEEGISTLIADQVDSVVGDKLENSKKDKEAIIKFQDFLSETAQDMGQGKPIVFIIDELDRCRPDFALDLLEQIKHIFSVMGITFLLVMNREQLEESVKVRYGRKIKAQLYLDKFVNIWLSLSKSDVQNKNLRAIFFNECIKKMLTNDERIKNTTTKSVLEDLIKKLSPSYRQIERILSYFAIFENTTTTCPVADEKQIIAASVIFLKAIKPVLLNEIFEGNKKFQDLVDILELNELDKSSDSNLFYLRYALEFDLSSDEVREQLLSNKETMHRYPRHRGVKYVNNFIQLFVDFQTVY